MAVLMQPYPCGGMMVQALHGGNQPTRLLTTPPVELEALPKSHASNKAYLISSKG